MDDSRPAPRLLDIAETCATLHLGRTKVSELIASGQLGSVVVGRRRLIPVEAVDRFVDELSSEAG